MGMYGQKLEKNKVKIDKNWYFGVRKGAQKQCGLLWFGVARFGAGLGIHPPNAPESR